MTTLDYKNGGYVLTWKIENFICLKEDTDYFDSSTFFLEALHKTEWCISIYRIYNSFNINIKRGLDDGPTNITLNCTISCSLPNDTSYQSHIIHTFIKNSREFIDNVELDDVSDIFSGGKLIISCHLFDISYVHIVTKCIFLRSVIIAEYRSTNCIIPNFRNCPLNHKLYFSVPPTCKTSTVFEIVLCISDISEDFSNSLQIDIIKSSDSEEFLHCKISLIGSEDKTVISATHNHLFEQSQENIWHFPHFIDKEKLSERQSLCLPDGSLCFRCEFLISEGKSVSWIEQSNDIPIHQYHTREITNKETECEMANLKDDLVCLYMENKCPDVELSAEGRRFPAHKATLCARSPVFSSMFDSDMREKESNVVEIADVDVETLDRMLFFMYSEILRDQKWCNITKLYIASDKYQILTLKEKCSSILKDNLSALNACEALVLAVMHHDIELQSHVKNFLLKDKSVFQSDDWNLFMESTPTVACKIMQEALLRNI